MRFFVAFLVLALGVSAAHKGLRSHLKTDPQSPPERKRAQPPPATSFVRSLTFKYTLRVCNAYGSENKLEIIKGKDVLADGVAYKECTDINTDLKSADKIEFKFDETEAGTFSIQDLPQNDATLLLMIMRHDTVSSAVAFESHVFANLENSQVAVLDMYKGAEKSTVKIQDTSKAKLSRSEDLRYNSVVAVNPGKYNCVLVGADGAEKASAPLTAAPKESYVVFRVGLESGEKDKGYAEEVVVFPKPPKEEKGAASGGSLMALLVALGVELSGVG